MVVEGVVVTGIWVCVGDVGAVGAVGAVGDGGGGSRSSLDAALVSFCLMDRDARILGGAFPVCCAPCGDGCMGGNGSGVWGSDRAEYGWGYVCIVTGWVGRIKVGDR